MKTYTKTVTETKPRLVIQYDSYPRSPREDDNHGYFITVQRNYNSPDNYEPDIAQFIKTSGDEAESIEAHMKAIKKYMKEDRNEKVLYITPIYMYEHGNIVYKQGTANGFDISNCGFYIITDKTHELVCGDDKKTKKQFIASIDTELSAYSSYVNGEVYGYTLYDEAGEEEDACHGFYSLKDIQDQLPAEWKDEDMQEYFIN